MTVYYGGHDRSQFYRQLFSHLAFNSRFNRQGASSHIRWQWISLVYEPLWFTMYYIRVHLSKNKKEQAFVLSRHWGMGLEIAGVYVVIPNSFYRHTCNCVLWHYMQNFKKKKRHSYIWWINAQSSDFCFILDFKASICLLSACCLIFSCFSCSFFFFSSSSCCSANFFARIFSRISNGGSEGTEMVQLGEVLCSTLV